MAKTLWCVTCALLLEAGLAASRASAGFEQDSPVPCLAASQTLRVHETFRPTVHDMWHRSPTFQRQIARLAAERGLVVTIDPWLDQGSRPYARTSFTRKNLELVGANVEIRHLDPDVLVEVVAHELEHVLEQIDGANLPGSINRQGIRNTAGIRTEFETERARRVGKVVSLEYREHGSGRDVCPMRPR
jgi:hypothetical protein